MALQLMDAFATFVDTLAQSLDDHDASGDDLAARAYLSRFHFDRVVGAAAGETPARLAPPRAARARRLPPGDEPARPSWTSRSRPGYSSNEAFTQGIPAGVRRRARPHGGRHPARIQLDAPNGVHFHPPGGLRLPARDEVTSMDLMTKMVEHHVWLVGEIVERAATLSARRASTGRSRCRSRASTDDPTLRSLLPRSVRQMDMWNAAMESRAYTSGSSETRAPRRSAPAAGRRTGFVAQAREVVGAQPTRRDVRRRGLRSAGGLHLRRHARALLTFGAHRRTLAIGALHSAGITDLGAGDRCAGRGGRIALPTYTDEGSRRRRATPDPRGRTPCHRARRNREGEIMKSLGLGFVVAAVVALAGQAGAAGPTTVTNGYTVGGQSPAPDTGLVLTNG